MWNKGFTLNEEYFNILFFGQEASKTWHLRIYRKTFKIVLHLLTFGLISITFFFCDYIQLRKKTFELARFRQEIETQKSQIQFFSARIEDLEEQLSKLNDFDQRIRIVANLEKGQETTPLMGLGGPSPSDIREKLKNEKDGQGLVRQMRTDIEHLQSEVISRKESLSELEKPLQNKKEMLAHTPSIWPAMGWVTSEFGLRRDPFVELSQTHKGIDTSNQTRTPATPLVQGTISDSGKVKSDRAISDNTKANEINPKSSLAYTDRGLAHKRKGDYDRAISDYTKAIEINSKDAMAHNRLAWLLATATAPDLRDGKKAVELALKACELSNWRNPGYLDTLAAAYARIGNFGNAVKWQEKALESRALSNNKEGQQRLDSYRERKPWPAN
jgi:tetratricopeptide (TPR) repeat protein